MVRKIGFTIFGTMLLLAPGPGWANGEQMEDQAKAIFLKYKCEKCHSVQAEGIGKTLIRDLSSAGKDSTGKNIPPEFIAKWLKREVKINGKTHMRKKFEGKPQELDTLSIWLSSLRHKEKGHGEQ